MVVAHEQHCYLWSICSGWFDLSFLHLISDNEIFILEGKNQTVVCIPLFVRPVVLRRFYQEHEFPTVQLFSSRLSVSTTPTLVRRNSTLRIFAVVVVLCLEQ